MSFPSVPDSSIPNAFALLWKPPDLDKVEKGLVAAGIQLKQEKLAWKTTAPAKWRAYLLDVWRRRCDVPGVVELYTSKLLMAEQFLQQWKQAHPELVSHVPVTFDAWYTKPVLCHYVGETLGMAYVGVLADHDQVILKDRKERLDDFAARLKAEHLQAVQEGQPPIFKRLTIHYKGERLAYYGYCQTHRLYRFGKVRLVISHQRADLSDQPAFTISNRLKWQALGMLRIRRHRWPVEVYHEEGKDEGLDQYQLRDIEAIERHVALVAVVYSLLLLRATCAVSASV